TDNPRAIISTTPKNRQWLRDLTGEEGVVLRRASTRDNPALPQRAVARLERRYGGTRLGRQELEAEWVDDVEGAMWQSDWIEGSRVALAERPFEGTVVGQAGRPVTLLRVVVGLDPAGTHKIRSDFTGLAAV